MIQRLFIIVGLVKVKNPLINKCIESWKRYCSDYEIIEWNEKNFDINVDLPKKHMNQKNMLLYQIM